MRDFLISKKHVVRNYWTSQTDMDNDFAAGNIWIAYSWAGSYVAAKDAGLDVTYMEPKEGRLSWVCGFVLMKDCAELPPRPRVRRRLVEHGVRLLWIEKNYAYGHANTAVDLDKLDPAFVDLLHLDDPSALQEPKAHMDRYIENRKEYNTVLGRGEGGLAARR